MKSLPVKYSLILFWIAILYFIIDRSSKRPSRLSALKSKSSIEKEEDESIVNDNEIDDHEDPSESFQLGDIVWVRVRGNPWWPTLIYGREEKTVLFL